MGQRLLGVFLTRPGRGTRGVRGEDVLYGGRLKVFGVVWSQGGGGRGGV